MSLRFEMIQDQSSWELFVLRHAPQSLFQSYTWGEVQKRTGHTVYRYGIYERDTLIGIIQAALIRAKRGSFLHVRHGPILSSRNRRVWKQTLAFLAKEAKQHRCWFVRMNPLWEDSEVTRKFFREFGCLPASIHRMDGEYCWVLDLHKTEEELLGDMRKTTRYEIRRASKGEVQVYTTTDPKNLKEFDALYAATSTRHRFIPHVGIKEEFELFAKRNQAMLYVGKQGGVTTACAIILYYGNQAIYHHGASLPSKAAVSYAVQWEAITEAKKRGMKVYNFWGIAPEGSPKHPWRGITLFKTGFGGRSIEYLHAQDLPVSPLYWLTRVIESGRRMMRGYD